MNTSAGFLHPNRFLGQKTDDLLIGTSGLLHGCYYPKLSDFVTSLWYGREGAGHTAIETKSFAKLMGLKPITTPVTSPQSNGIAESFVKTLKRDYAKLANRPDSKTVMAQLQGWFDDYNSYGNRPLLQGS